MLPVLLALAIFVLAFAVPYLAPRVGLAAGALGMALAVMMMMHAPTAPGELPARPRGLGLHLDFDMSRPIGIALGLYSLLWLLVSTVQLTRAHAPTR